MAKRQSAVRHVTLKMAMVRLPANIPVAVNHLPFITGWSSDVLISRHLVVLWITADVMRLH
jgi:hypothetical protein